MRGLFYSLLCMSLVFVANPLWGQKVMIEGYVYESGNRGFLNEVQVTVLDKATKVLKTKAISNPNGVFLAEVPAGGEYILKATKKIFESKDLVVSTVGKNPGDKVFVKMELSRMPGYRFEVTIAETRESPDIPVDAIHNARIEVFNNTTQKAEMEIEDNPTPTFAVQFEQGNHYTIMLRKEGYFTKRMEAYVNVKGCILCFDGVGEVTPGQPGVSDVLTESNTMGTLLANVEMMPIKMNKAIVIDNIYYDVNKYRLKSKVRSELDKLAVVLIDNPELLIEIGSHTDSTGDDKYNMKLSRNRARKVVEYLVSQGVNKDRIVAKGYGETKLTNRCKNGVDCSERRHAKNRRTELKVIGYAHESVASNKSLVEIKEAEAFEKMLLEIQNQEVVEIKEGEELPDEIKKQMMGEEDGETKKEESTDETEEAMNEQVEESVKTKTEPVTEVIAAKDKIKEMEAAASDVVVKEEVKSEAKQIVATKTEVTTPIEKETLEKIPAKAEKEAASVLGGSTVYSRTKPKAKVSDKPLQSPSTVTEKPVVSPPNPKKEIVEKVEEKVEEKAEEFDAEYGESEQSFGEVEVNTEHTALMREAHLLASEYTGYMVQFYTSPSALPSSHEIFSKHGNITFEERKDGVFAYLLGDFKHEEDAEKFLETIMSKRYPGARVIRFRRGNRMN